MHQPAIRRRDWLLGTAASLATLSQAQAADAPLPIFDAHLHYSHDAWEKLPPKDAVALLRKAGLKRAMVSSSSDEGTQMLYAEAPDLIIPSLRPYRKRGELGTWMHDASVVGMLEQRLEKYKYAAIGEYHIYGKDADLPVMRKVVGLAKQYRIFLHSHSDADAIERQFQQDPGARILWAHSGFDAPEKVRAMLGQYPNLWCDLAFRSDHATMGRVDPGWRAAFLAYPDRFVVGTDTFTPERWYYIGEHADWTRAWLADVPRDVAERIAYRNGEALFASLLKA
ncbi:amidohydrolase [Hydrogenophaga sp. PAMC20947]|nr:amidohydrolase [Hydrogenophaga sp. PAMC20947]